MAVMIPSANAWTAALILWSMADVDSDRRSRNAFDGLTSVQKANFRLALLMDRVVPLAEIIQSPAPPVALQVVRATLVARAAPAAPAVPTPEHIGPFRTTQPAFRSWLERQAALVLVAGHPGLYAGLVFQLGSAYVLGDRTISVPICIYRCGWPWPGTDFVFHYHPDAAARSADPYASTGHFKPNDGGQVRVMEHETQRNMVLTQLRRDALASARRAPRR